MVDQPVYPRPVQEKLPFWVGVGGTSQSFVRAGMLGLPLMVAVIGGETEQFRPLVAGVIIYHDGKVLMEAT